MQSGPQEPLRDTLYCEVKFINNLMNFNQNNLLNPFLNVGVDHSHFLTFSKKTVLNPLNPTGRFCGFEVPLSANRWKC
jgi:Ca2+-dependent lipid-binding protein